MYGDWWLESFCFGKARVRSCKLQVQATSVKRFSIQGEITDYQATKPLSLIPVFTYQLLMPWLHFQHLQDYYHEVNFKLSDYWFSTVTVNKSSWDEFPSKWMFWLLWQTVCMIQRWVWTSSNCFHRIVFEFYQKDKTIIYAADAVAKGLGVGSTHLNRLNSSHTALAMYKVLLHPPLMAEYVFYLIIGNGLKN